MSGTTMNAADAAKRRAAERAVSLVQDGMIVGIGSGSTVAFAIDALIARVRDEHLRVRGVATSQVSATLAEAGGIPLMDLNDAPAIDLTIDGADEIDPRRDVIKGYGGALLREKLVAVSTKHLVIIADTGKIVERLGARGILPVEVIPFGWQRTADRLIAISLTPALRTRDGQTFQTDNGNYILDCALPPRFEAAALADTIKAIVGVLEHGFFLNLVQTVIIGTDAGVEVLT